MLAARVTAVALVCFLGATTRCADGNSTTANLDHAGWGASTDGGRGGRILRVTTLAAAGEGSFRAAAEAHGRRVVVFEVGGVIDLGGRSIRVGDPYLTVAGETAPSPGVTLIRAGLRLETHDVVVRHLRIRPGEAGHGKDDGWEVDAITTAGPDAHDIIVDHCSLSWATDENLTATGPRFRGSTPEEWRLGTSRRITFSNNIVAEGLSDSTHRKGEHSKGMLIHDNVTEVTILGNLYAHNVQRNPFFKGGSSGVVANNLIYDPGSKAMHYALRADEWGDHQHETGELIVAGNVLKLGPASTPDVPLVLIEGDGPVALQVVDNIILDRSGRAVETPSLVRDPSSLRRRLDERFGPDATARLPATEVLESVLRNAGARPWDRDPVDARLIAEVRSGEGRIVDDQEEVGGYPHPPSTQRPFVEDDWDLNAEPMVHLGESSAAQRGDARAGAARR